MLLWLGCVLAFTGILVMTIDRGTARYFRDRAGDRLHRLARHTTDWAKGGPWIVGALLSYLAVQIWMAAAGETAVPRLASDTALALLLGLVIGSVVLHTFKIFLGRRRPRDDFEHGLYGFRYFTWELQYDSFPSGHAMTIFSAAVTASTLAPALAPVWFAIAALLSVTRAILAAHFLSDVFIGAAIGIVSTREAFVLVYPHLAPAWF